MQAFEFWARFSNLFLILATFFSVRVVRSGRNDPNKSMRIIGGWLARPNEVPYIVSIQQDSGKSNEHWCGGSIFNEHFIITAAHCLFDETNLSVVAGTLDPTASILTNADAQVIKPKSSTVHSAYNIWGPVNDIGLLELEKGLVFNAAVQPIPIPATDTVSSGRAKLSGWGGTEAIKKGEFAADATKKLRTIELEIVPKVECDKMYREVSKKEIYGPQFEIRSEESELGMKPPSSGHLCAGSEGKDACMYDSGGPLQCAGKVEGKGQKYLCGVVSYGFGCGTVLPGAYTDVALYHDWIIQNTAGGPPVNATRTQAQ